MGTGWIRWDSLLPKQLLHAAVFEEVALSVRITPGAEKEKKKDEEEEKKLFAGSQTVQIRGQKLCQCRAKSSLGLNNRQKIRICQQGAKTKSNEAKNG